MKIGVKTYDNGKFLEHFRKKVDFAEILTIEGRDYEFAKQFSQFLPVIIHAQHYIFGSNPADKSKDEGDASSINFARKIADFTNAKRIILHPGVINNGSSSEENAVSFIKNLNDKKVLIENLPKYKDFDCLCTTPEDTKEFMKKADVKLCFDINHAIETAFQAGRDYKELIKEFIKLKPVHYHLGGQRIKEGIASHRSFQDSDIDLKEILKLLPADAEITIETEPDIEKTDNDLKAIKGVIEEISQN